MAQKICIFGLQFELAAPQSPVGSLDRRSAMNVQSFLDQMEVSYRLVRHQPSYTAQDLAQSEHIPGRQVIKPVIVRADGEFVMCALPASYRIDMDELKRQLDALEVQIADESTLRGLFPDCELGAEP